MKTDPRLSVHAAGDGVTDDTAAIQYAIWTASNAGGGTIYFPTGTYAVSEPGLVGNSVPINLANNVVLKGDGATASTLVMAGTNPANYGFSFSSYVNTHFGFLNMGFHNTSTGTGWSMAIGSSDHTFAIGCQFQADAGKNAAWTYCTNTVFKNCNIISADDNGSESVYFLSNTDTVFTNNTINYHWARVRLMNSIRTLGENNTLTRVTTATDYHWESGGFDISCDQQLALLSNTVNKGGSGNFSDVNNDGETIMCQGDGAPGKVVSTLTSATSTTMTDSTQSWGTNFFTDHSYPNALENLPGQGYYVAIVSGQGAGQIRQIVSNTSTTLTIDHPWVEQPGVGSYYSINYLQDHQVLVENNNLSQNRQGIELYDASLLDMAVVNNTLYDNGGITIDPFAVGAVDNPEYPVFCTVVDTVMAGNSVTVDNASPYTGSDSYAQVSVQTLRPETGTGLGTSVYGWEVRNNSVVGPTASLNGQLYWLTCTTGGGEFDQTATDADNVGTIFEGNSATNSTNGYLLGTSDVNTVIWNPTITNVSQMVKDLPGLSYINASVDTTRSDLVAHWTLDESSGTTSFEFVGLWG